MHFVRDDVRVHVVCPKQPPTFASALWSVATVEMAKNQLSRDFRYCSIFDFFNTIPRITDTNRTWRECVSAPMLIGVGS